jgi:hypothetical protein
MIKLALILSATFLGTVMLSVTLAALLLGTLSERGFSGIAFCVIYPVFCGLLAMWTTMVGRYPLWQAIGVEAAAVIWESSQHVDSVAQGLAIPAILFFGVCSVPLLLLRGFGVVLTVTSATHSSNGDRRLGQHMPLTTPHIAEAPDIRPQVRQLSAGSLLCASLVVSAMATLLFWRVSPDILDQFVGWDWFLLAVYYAAVFPLTTMVTLSVSRSVSKLAVIGLVAAVMMGGAFLWTVCADPLVIPVVVGAVPVCLVIGNGWLYVAGFRMSPGDSGRMGGGGSV